jgi:hypothetical protein
VVEEAGLLSTVLAEKYFEQLMAGWRPARARGRMRGLLDEYVERDLRPELRPADARLISWLNIAFPNDFRKR